MTTAKILIVEDEIVVARDIHNRLSRLGYTVAGSTPLGEEAVRLAAELRPDLVLMDIRLQGAMDGVAAAEQILSRLQLPVVYLTAYADEDTLQRARVTEPFGYILKPFEERELRTVIEMALYKHQAERRLRASEHRYAVTLQSIGDAVIAADSRAAVTFLNPVAETLTGWRQTDALGRSIAEVFPIVDEETRAALEDPVSWVLRSGTVVGLANHTLLQTRDGREVPIDDCAAPIREEGAATLSGAVLVFHDVSARRRAEAMQATHFAVTRILAEAGDLGDAVPRLLEAIGRGLGWHAAGLWRPEADGRLVSRGTWHAPAPAAAQLAQALAALVVTPGQGLLGRAWQSERPVWGEDVAAAEAVPACGACACPVRGGGGGVLALFGPAGSPPGPDLLEVLTTIASQVGQFLDRKQAEEALRLSEQRYRSLVESARDAIFTVSGEGTLTSLSPAFEAITGWPCERWLGRPFASLVHQEDVPRVLGLFAKVFQGQTPPLFEARLLGRAGGYAVVECKVTPQWSAGAVVGCSGIARDVTERKQLEQQFAHAQRMEAVGRLAGGVAHDFNNLMTAIISYADLVLENLFPSHPLRPDLEAIKKAGWQAAGLTRQLLAFSRKQALRPRVLNPGAVVAGTEKMLRCLVGEEVELVLALAADVRPVLADQGQLEQVIMNLAVNARDAMPTGGRLTIALCNARAEDTEARARPALPPGPYVLLEVADTGCGMSAEVQARLFEPFFTTKEAGKGTGLGLAVVYGIVKAAGGDITVTSEPGHGSTFRIWLPPSAEPSGQQPAPAAEAYQLARGQGTVLVVEDEEVVRALARRILEESGYAVLEARHPADALALAGKHRGPINLLLTDVVLPGMSGPELARRLAAERSETRVLYMSGYPERLSGTLEVPERGGSVLAKPFTPALLARRVREVLTSEASSDNGANI
jgi:PAS domain S-box-containing protein